TGEMLTLALVNGENRSESVDRVEFHDYTQEENDRKHRETELEAQRRREQHEREKTERETFARQRLDQLLNLHPTQTAFPFVVESSKTADGVVRAAGVREKEYFLAIVEIERKNKTADFSQPIFTFEGQALAPAFVKPVPATGNNPIIFAGGFIIPQWLTTTTGKEISVSVNFNRKTALLRLEPNASPKDVIPQVAQPVSTPDPLTTQARQISKEPTDRPAPAVSAPPVSLPGPVKQVTVIEAQQRLMQMVETTNHSETTLKFAQNKEVSVGLKWQRFGQFALVVLSIQRKLGASELKLSAPAWTLSAPVTPLSVFQPLPGLFGTRPLVSGFLLQIPDADAAALQVMCSLSFNQNVLQVRAPATVPPVITDDSLQAQVKPEPPPSQPQTLTNEPKDFSGSAKPVAPNEPKTTTSAPPPTSAPVRSNPDNAPSTPVRVSKRRDDRTKANPKAPVGSLRSQLEQFVLSGTRKDKVERYSLEGVVVKIFEVREIGNQFWVSGEMTNTGDQTLSEVEGFIHTEIGGGMGMVASRNIPATETHCERQKLEAGDHGIFGFILPKKASVLVLHFQWKQGNEIRSFEISPRAQRPELEASK
ncbi:MAG TPA: hypothetical protein PLL06_20575, partial [Acidobacteriota bacterium]|nr:hypothetical protein [Acidobacteriota bacterium]